MILPIVLIATSLWKQNQTVSFVGRAEPMSHLVVDLSKLTGIKLTTSKECANDVLLISAQNVPADKLLAEIAKVDAGKWDKNGDGLRFSANPAARHAEARAESSRMTKLIRSEIQQVEAEMVKQAHDPGRQEDGGVIPTIEGLSPADAKTFNDVASGAATKATILTILKNIDPDLLVLQREQRVVFSTHPTGMQIALEPGADALIADLVEKRNAAAKIVQSLSGSQSLTPPREIRNLQTIAGYVKANLVIEDDGTPGVFEAQLTLYGSDGDVPYRSRMVQIHPAEEGDAGQPVTAPITVSEAAKGFRAIYMSQRIGNSYLVAVPPAAAPFLTDVEHNDPLALSPSDMLLALAQAHNKPLIAVVPDSAFMDATAVGVVLSLQNFEHSLAKEETMTMSNSGDWIEIKPSNPATARQYRCDRSVLGSFLRTCLKESIPTLDEFANFTTQVEYANNDVVTAYLSTAVSGYGNAGLSTELTWNLYRIYAEFSSEQRATLASGGKLPISALSASQVASFNQFGYGGLERLTYGRGPARLNPQFPSARPLGPNQGGGIPMDGLPPARGFEDESTELLPNGVQANSYIEMKVYDEPFVSPWGKATTPISLTRVMGVAQMANRQTRSKQPDFGQNGAINYVRFKLGTRQLHLLTIHGSDRAFVSGRLYDFHLYSDSPDFALSDLPTDWRSELTRRVGILQQQSAASQARRVTPPPGPR